MEEGPRGDRGREEDARVMIVMHSNEFKTKEKQKLNKIKINCNIYTYLLKTESLDNAILPL